MDDRLRQLERTALVSKSKDDIRSFLVAAYRAGLYRMPNRAEIQRILREQVKDYVRRGMKIQPRYLHGGRNISGLLHPDEVSAWDGERDSWRSALRRAQPGEKFEVDIYYRVVAGRSHDWSLSSTIALSVPAELYIFDGAAYGPPEQSNPYCRCSPRV